MCGTSICTEPADADAGTTATASSMLSSAIVLREFTLRLKDSVIVFSRVTVRIECTVTEPSLTLTE